MDREYFTNYCGYGSYEQNYLWHSGIEHCVHIVDRLGIDVGSVLVLGAATGQVLQHFDRAWGVKPFGCEISRWAHSRIPGPYRRRIRCGDMRRYVPELLRQGRTFDLLFCNSLVYLEPAEIPAFLEKCSRIAGHFHFWSSTTEEYEAGDRYRVTLRPYAWWNETFKRNGFRRTRSRYLWRSGRAAALRMG